MTFKELLDSVSYDKVGRQIRSNYATFYSKYQISNERNT